MTPALARTVMAVMAKRPMAGRTKTRLVPPLTHETAAGLYASFLADTLDRLRARGDCALVIALDAPDSASYFEAVAPGVPHVLQVGETLGERLDAVLGACLGLGYESACAIASDSPDLPATHVASAIELLSAESTDIVLGPTDDGGYWLIGWKRAWSPVVTEVTMSTSSVLADTIEVAERVGARVALAPEWYDVDDGDDLARLQSTLDADLTPNTARFLNERVGDRP